MIFTKFADITGRAIKFRINACPAVASNKGKYMTKRQ